MDESSNLPEAIAKALRLAQERQRPLLFAFFASSGQCKRFLHKADADEEVFEWMREEVCLVWSRKQGESILTRHLRVHEFPAFLHLDQNGREIERIVGFREAWVFLNDARELLKGRSVLGTLQKRLKADPDNAELRFDLGKRLVERGRFEEALVEFLVVWDLGPTSTNVVGSAQRTVDPSRAIARLGEHLPQALDELRERKRNCVAQLSRPGGESRFAWDFIALNKIVGAPQEALELWGSLARVPPESARDKNAAMTDFMLLREVRPLLIAERRYEEFLGGQFRRVFFHKVDLRSRIAAFVKESRVFLRVERESIGRLKGPESTRNTFVESALELTQLRRVGESADYFEALLGITEIGLAFWFADKCLNELDVVLVADEFATRCERLGLVEEQDRLRALQTSVRSKRQ